MVLELDDALLLFNFVLVLEKLHIGTSKQYLKSVGIPVPQSLGYITDVQE